MRFIGFWEAGLQRSLTGFMHLCSRSRHVLLGPLRYSSDPVGGAKETRKSDPNQIPSREQSHIPYQPALLSQWFSELPVWWGYVGFRGCVTLLFDKVLSINKTWKFSSSSCHFGLATWSFAVHLGPKIWESKLSPLKSPNYRFFNMLFYEFYHFFKWGFIIIQQEPRFFTWWQRLPRGVKATSTVSGQLLGSNPAVHPGLGLGPRL